MTTRSTRTKAAASEPARTPVAAPRHWHGERDADNIHWLTLDKDGASTNTLSQDVLAAFDSVLAELAANPPAGLVIRSGKANGFVAGADVSEFRGLRDPGAVEQLVRRGHAILDRLEALPYPTVALINGFCLGGGLELALACRYRVASDDARLGLPEVRLGIHPGLGGTARLTRLIPAPAAMGLMLTGRTLRARAAKRMGIVDAVTQPRHFERAARWAVTRGLKTQRRPILTALSKGQMPGPEASIIKLVTASKMQDISIFGTELQDMGGVMPGSDAPMAGLFQGGWLGSPGLRIAGGTDEILRNIIAERVLGKPADIRVDKDKPFNELPTGNA